MNKNKRKLILGCSALIFCLVLSGLLFWPRHTTIDLAMVDRNLTQQGYSLAEIQTFKDELKPDQIFSLSVLEYLPDALERVTLPHYLELKQLGYAPTEARLMSGYDNEMLVKVMAYGHVEGVLDWLKTPYLMLDRIPRYHALALIRPSYSKRFVVEVVNADADHAPYTQVSQTDVTAELILVNKYRFLSSSYVPTDLVKAQGCGDPTLAHDAAKAFELMCQDITKAGLAMAQDNGYRSYDEQTSLYTTYLKLYGQTYTDTVAARPGFSEHQTGLSVDLTAGKGSFGLFVTTKTYAWVSAHCADYGFILRYPKGKEAVTGYRFESWHYRYVGIETAKAIQESGLTLDEYVLVFP